MIDYYKTLSEIIKNYNKYLIPLVFYEIVFFIKYKFQYNKIIYLNNNIFADCIPCSFFALKKIEKFIKKKKIKRICDLGSGIGKIIYYFGHIKNYSIDGIENNKKIFSESIKLKKFNINLFNENIINYNYNKQKYDLLIANDPLKKKRDFFFLIQQLKKIRYKTYIIFINLDLNKKKIIFNNFKIINYFNISKKRNIIFCNNL